MDSTPAPAAPPPSDSVTSAVRALVADGRQALSARMEALLSERSEEARVHIGLPTAMAYAGLLDGVMAELYETARGTEHPPLAVAAVGGYGRGALAYGSDLDIRLLTDAPQQTADFAQALLYPLWDAGLSVGHQVVSTGELLEAAKHDLPTATGLLDWRTVAGDGALSEQLLSRAAGSLFACSALPAFMDRLEQEARDRHARFGGSVYLLEPDVKNGRGGLRDLDVARWAARARWQVQELSALVSLGVLVPRQLAEVMRSANLLWALRNTLHQRAGRRRDRLNFDEQEAIAEQLGFSGSLREAVERMMSDYYRAARTISRFRDMILARARPQLNKKRPTAIDLGGGLQLFDDEVTVRRSELLQQDPALALAAVKVAVERNLPLRPSFRNALVSACSDAQWAERLRGDRRAAHLFVELMTCCKLPRLKAGTVARELHDVGLLLAMIPEFSPLVGRVHHDTYHVYTVDVHSVAAVDRLGEIIRGDVVFDEREGQPWRGSLAAQLGADIARPHVVFFATLLHDVGKAIGRADHSERGAELVRQILARLPFDPADIDDVCKMVLHHLAMYRIATRRDVDDPATPAELAALVGDRRGLRELYLLTVADLSTTSPTSMTEWKAHMLDALYVATDRFLTEGTDNERAARKRSELQASAAAAAPGARSWVSAYAGAMPRRYLESHGAPAIATHAMRVEQHISSGRAASIFSLSQKSGSEMLCVVAADRPGLLADITAALANNRLQVNAAAIYSCPTEPLRAALADAPDLDADALPAHLAVDFFWVQSASPVRTQLPRAQRDLDALLTGEQSSDTLMRSRLKSRRRRNQPAVATKVLIDNRVSRHHTVVEVFTRDRPALLYLLAHALYEQGVSIARAKIATEGTRAVDVFYVLDQTGAKITDRPRVEALRSAITQRVGAGNETDGDAPSSEPNAHVSRPRL